jgi:UDP-N-acetylglucosamine 4,6-dehydratase
MRMVDLAKAMAPNLPHKIVGIRPGEKLHEVMVTEDDSRTTVEMTDRYVIRPAFPFWSGANLPGELFKPVPEGFRYSSDTNTQWLDQKSLKTILDETP